MPLQRVERVESALEVALPEASPRHADQQDRVADERSDEQPAIEPERLVPLALRDEFLGEPAPVVRRPLRVEPVRDFRHRLLCRPARLRRGKHLEQKVDHRSYDGKKDKQHQPSIDAARGDRMEDTTEIENRSDQSQNRHRCPREFPRL